MLFCYALLVAKIKVGVPRCVKFVHCVLQKGLQCAAHEPICELVLALEVQVDLIDESGHDLVALFGLHFGCLDSHTLAVLSDSLEICACSRVVIRLGVYL